MLDATRNTQAQSNLSQDIQSHSSIPDICDLVIQPQNYTAEPRVTTRMVQSPRSTSPEYRHDDFSSLIGMNCLDDDGWQAGANSPLQFQATQPAVHEDRCQDASSSWGQNANVNTAMSSEDINNTCVPTMSLNNYSTVDPISMDHQSPGSQAITSAKNIGMQQLDDRFFQGVIFGFVLRKFEMKYPGCKRFNWQPETRRLKVKEFFQQDLQVYVNDYEYSKHEALLFKLIFTSYSKTKMIKHGFSERALNAEWTLIDQVRQRKFRNIYKNNNQRDFLKLKVIQEIRNNPSTGFYNSDEMSKFVREEIAEQREEYIKHFEKFCCREFLNFN